MSLKFDEDSETAHEIFVKLYRSDKKTLDKPVGKTLTILNLPPYATEDALKQLFTKFAGQVEKVEIPEDSRFKFKAAFVVFKKSESIELVMKSKNELPSLSNKECEVLTGIAKWTEEHNNRIIVDSEELQISIDTFMKSYEKAQSTIAPGEEDADEGWTVVGKQSKEGFQQKQSTISKLEQKVRNHKLKSRHLKNFYSFELKESKKQQLLELRKKLDNDRMKMHSIRQTRKFKP